jgi:protein O-mannosyl-transferase
MNKKPNNKTTSILNANQDTSKNTSKNKQMLFLLVAVLFITFIIYSKVIYFNLLSSWDDAGYISNNYDIQYFGWENLKNLFSTFYGSNYQPLTMLLYAIESKIIIGSVSMYHLTNIFLHLINSFLVFRLIKKLSPQNGIVALITAVFFAIHPMHVESVAWVSEQKDLLYSFFFLLALIKYAEYTKELAKKKYLICGFVFFILSCLSKSAAVIMPLALLLIDYYQSRKITIILFVEKIPFFLISLLFGIIAIYSQKGAIQEMAPVMNWIEHISVVSHSFINYIFKALIPVQLSAIYPYPAEIGKSSLPLFYYFSLILFLALWAFVWYSKRWGKDIIFGFLFFTITILLVLQLLPVGGAAMADRYTYIPYIGIFFIIGKLVEHLSTSHHFKKIKTYSLFFLVVLFSAFVFQTNLRTEFWKNDEILFSDVIDKFPECKMAYLNRGVYRQSIENYQAAIDDYNKAIEIYPKYDMAYNNRGFLKKELKDFSESILDYNIAVKLNPKNSLVYYNRGLSKQLLNDIQGAIDDYSRAIEIEPKYFCAFTDRGISKCMKKDLAGAMIDYNTAINFQPHYYPAYTNRGIAKCTLGNFIEGITDFDKSIEINHKNADAFNNRAIANYNLKNYQKAMDDWDMAIQINPDFTQAIQNRNYVKSLLENTSK